MTRAALEERLRQVNLQLKKAQEEQKAKAKEAEELKGIVHQAQGDAAEASSELSAFGSRVANGLEAFSNLKFSATYRGWFTGNYQAEMNGFMGSVGEALSEGSKKAASLTNEEQEKKSLAAKLRSQAESLKRELEGMANTP